MNPGEFAKNKTKTTTVFGFRASELRGGYRLLAFAGLAPTPFLEILSLFISVGLACLAGFPRVNDRLRELFSFLFRGILSTCFVISLFSEF